MAASRRECFCAAVVVFSILVGQALAQDKWELCVRNAGVSAMSAALMHTNRVIIYDRTDFGESNLTHPDSYCRDNPNDIRLKHDCTAHSVALDLANCTIKALKIFSDPWCSSAAHKADGTLLSTGGWNDGSKVIRTIGPNPKDDWREFPNAPNSMVSSRWYASNHILPDNRVIVVGGRRAFSYEFVPRAKNEGQYTLPFLKDTYTPGSEYNLYPFIFLAPDGNLFLFANQDSILFNYRKNAVVRKYNRIPDGPRNYPASGSAVLLPLHAADGYKRAEVLICGGTPVDAFQNVGRRIYNLALQSCGRLVFTDPKPKWSMTTMPMPRLMGDMLHLPTGEILIINGARRGSAGWKAAKEPVFTPVTYNPSNNRFFTWSPSTIPRMYHSTALVLPDGKIFVGGSNVHVGYQFDKTKTDRDTKFPTELRIEKYSPYYLNKRYNLRRPQIVGSPAAVRYNVRFKVSFRTGQKPGIITVRLYAPSFTTHSFSMNQRMLVLRFDPVVTAKNVHGVVAYSPPNSVIAPAGFYMCTVVNDGTPSPFVWIKIG